MRWQPFRATSATLKLNVTVLNFKAKSTHMLILFLEHDIDINRTTTLDRAVLLILLFVILYLPI